MSPGILRKELRSRIEPGRAETLQSFFKTGPGEYGEGDRFLGVRMPDVRDVAALDDGRLTLDPLLHSKWHEERLLALVIMVRRFQSADEPGRAVIFKKYLRETKWINNWDLVDVSAHHIVGAHLVERPREILRRLARSSNLWERRIAIVSTFAFLKLGQTADTFELSRRLMQYPHDLIHKACGWMLREAGKCNRGELERFLLDEAGHMPRTMLRYAIERFPEATRRRLLRHGR